MKRVLRILNRLNVGGPSYNVANLSKYLSEDFQTKVLAGFKEPDEASSEYLLQDLGISYQIVPNMHRSINLKADYRAFQYILREINAYQPDLVHTHAAKAGALGRMAAFKAKNKPKAIVHTYHGNVFDGYFSPLKSKVILGIERYLANKTDAIISISETQKKDLVEKYRIAPPEKIHVIPLGFDLQKFVEDPETKRKQFRDQYEISASTIVISIVGRLAPVKNHTLFIEALKICKQQTQIDFKVFMVGDGEEMELIKKQCIEAGFSICLPNETNWSATIIFTSWRKDIDTINAGSDIIALSSINEGTPVSIIEAMASGKAVICTNVGGVSDVVTDGKNGLLSSLSPTDFARQLLSLIENENLRNRLSANASTDVIDRYSYFRLIKDIEALYYKLLTK